MQTTKDESNGSRYAKNYINLIIATMIYRWVTEKRTKIKDKDAGEILDSRRFEKQTSGKRMRIITLYKD